MSLLIAVRAEALKAHKTAAFYFTLISAAFIPVIYTLNIFTHGLPDEDESNKDPLNSIFMGSGVMNSVAIYPIFVIVLCTLLAQIEYRNQTWKQVLSAPRSRASVFISKFITVQMLLLLFLAANHLFNWIVAVIAHYQLPKLNVLYSAFNGRQILLNVLTMYITTLALCTVQFWISLRFKNFLIGIAVGLALWLTGTLLALEMRSPMAEYFPYSFPSMSVKSQTTAFNGISLVFAGVLLLIGYLDFRKTEKG